MSGPEEIRQKKLELKMRQRLHVSWIHVEGCPVRGELVQRPERCRCGMPPVLALEAAREAALETLREGLERGEWWPSERIPS